MGVESLAGLPRRPAPIRRWRRASRFRIGPLRSVSEAAPHPILRGMRSGAVAGLSLVAVLSLPVLLVLTVTGRRPVEGEGEAPARVWAVEPPARARAESLPESAAKPAAVVTAVAEPVPSRAVSAAPPEAARPGRSPLSLDLIPVLDDASGALTIAEPAALEVRPARPGRVTAAARPPRTP